MFGLTGFIALVRTLGLLIWFRLDTPKYYISKQENEKAKEVLKKFYEENLVLEKFNDLNENAKTVNSESLKDVCTNLSYPLMIGVILSFFM